MKTINHHTWVRAGIIAIAGLLLLGNFLSLATWKVWTDPSVTGTLGGSIGPGVIDERLRIDSVVENGALAKAGAQVGDLIVFRHPGVRSLVYLSINETIAATLYTQAGPRDIALHPEPVAPGTSSASIPLALIAIINSAMAISLAVIIVMRKGRDGAMLAFAASLLANAPTEFEGHLPVGLLQDWSVFIIRGLDYCGGYWLFLFFALTYPSQYALWKRRGVAPATLAFGIIFLVISYASYLSKYGLLHIPHGFANFVNSLGTAMAVGTAIVTLAVLVHSWMRSTGTTRDRLGWILLSIGVTYLMWIWVNASNLVGMALPASTPMVSALINFLGYIGFGYALLRHRIFDFGFAVNRALVYTCISTLLLMVFGVTEFAVDKMLHFQGREKNIIFDAIVALGVILSFHRIQHWIAHRVDHTFFHGWQEAAERLRRAFEQTAHITSGDVLLERAGAAVIAFTGARGVAIYELKKDGGYCLRRATMAEAPSEIGVDHPLAVALRYRAEAMQADEAGLPPALAVPLILRGAPSGLLLLAGDEGRLTLRPDQASLLTSTTGTLAMQLEAVRIHELDAHARQLREQAAELRKQLRDSEREARDLRSGILDLRDANAALRALAGI